MAAPPVVGLVVKGSVKVAKGVQDVIIPVVAHVVLHVLQPVQELANHNVMAIALEKQ